MGIKHLNRFLRDNCSGKAIHSIHLHELCNRVVVIDTSIYLYKFSCENRLLENMYLFISILKRYQIEPIFVFDGKPPAEKKDLLCERKRDKQQAEQQYNILQEQLRDAENEDEKKRMLLKMESLKKHFVKVHTKDINKVKMLMKAYGVQFLDADEEADVVCAYMVHIGKAWACISDDMDMFLYNCPRVIRNVNLHQHMGTFYDMNIILDELEMSSSHFCEIMVLSGTDYNIHSTVRLSDTIQWFYEYRLCQFHSHGKAKPYSFYIWLLKYTNYIQNYAELLHIYRLFQFSNNTSLEKWKQWTTPQTHYSESDVRTIMETDGFVFLSHETPKSETQGNIP